MILAGEVDIRRSADAFYWLLRMSNWPMARRDVSYLVCSDSDGVIQ